LSSQALVDEIRSRNADGLWSFEILVPVGDGDRAIAERRLATTLAALAEYGVSVTGRVAEGDVVAVGGAEGKSRQPHEIVVATLPLGSSAWMRQDAVDRIRKASGNVPTTHFIANGDDARAIGAASSLPLTMIVATEAVGAEALAATVMARSDVQPSRFSIVCLIPAKGPHSSGFWTRSTLVTVV
jgi:hypothetical protein